MVPNSPRLVILVEIEKHLAKPDGHGGGECLVAGRRQASYDSRIRRAPSAGLPLVLDLALDVKDASDLVAVSQFLERRPGLGIELPSLGESALEDRRRAMPRMRAEYLALGAST